VNLWDSDTDQFQSKGNATPLAYIDFFQPELVPWILAEDTEDAGSRVAIHDSSMFLGYYNHSWDTVPNKNFKFVYNLCTKFPQ
jgi:hypothetical protein